MHDLNCTYFCELDPTQRLTILSRMYYVGKCKHMLQKRSRCVVLFLTESDQKGKRVTIRKQEESKILAQVIVFLNLP